MPPCQRSFVASTARGSNEPGQLSKHGDNSTKFLLLSRVLWWRQSMLAMTPAMLMLGRKFYG